MLGNINAMDDRSAMGLPETYVAPSHQVAIASATRRLLGKTANYLSALAENPDATLAERWAGAALLSIGMDDPRIGSEPKMVVIDGGWATIGTDPKHVSEIAQKYKPFGVRPGWIEKECPKHSVFVESFAVAKYPVTNIEYAEFLRATHFTEFPTHWHNGVAPMGQENHPVYTVTAGAADAYAAWLANKTARQFRLLTECEWEYAASGAEGAAFPWGDDFVTECANTMEARHLTTSPVGIYPSGKTSTGICDMAGNVEEYVSTCYSPYPGWHIVEDDLYRELGTYRIARGGAFNRFADLARCQRRHGAYPKSLYAIGFRLAESI